MARDVLSNPEQWRSLFTATKEGKQDLMILVDQCDKLPLELVLKALETVIPNKKIP